MKYLILLSFLLISCATKAPKPIKVELKGSYSAHCSIDGNSIFEPSVEVLEVLKDDFIVKSSSDVLKLPQNSCFLTALKTNTTFSKSLDNRYVKCSLDNLKLNSDEIQITKDEKNFFELSRYDGITWIVPRETCRLGRMKDL